LIRAGDVLGPAAKRGQIYRIPPDGEGTTRHDYGRIFARELAFFAGQRAFLSAIRAWGIVRVKESGEFSLFRNSCRRAQNSFCPNYGLFRFPRENYYVTDSGQWKKEQRLPDSIHPRTVAVKSSADRSDMPTDSRSAQMKIFCSWSRAIPILFSISKLKQTAQLVRLSFTRPNVADSRTVLTLDAEGKSLRLLLRLG